MLLIFVAFVLFKQKGKKTVLETYTQSSGRYFCMLLSPIFTTIVVLTAKSHRSCPPIQWRSQRGPGPTPKRLPKKTARFPLTCFVDWTLSPERWFSPIHRRIRPSRLRLQAAAAGHVTMTDRPATVAEAMRNCDALLFPQIHILLQLFLTLTLKSTLSRWPKT